MSAGRVHEFEASNRPLVARVVHVISLVYIIFNEA
jgi:hypothetical protein